jgi:hypothetical protein
VIGDREKAALDAVLKFRGDSAALASRIGALERAVTGLTVEEAGAEVARQGVGRDLLAGAVLVKGLAAQIDVILHAVGILLSLPHVLVPGERIVSLSLGAGNTGRDWDLETDRQIAEFKFIKWKGADAIRQNTLFVDLFHLAEADTSKRRVLYLTGIAHPQKFLGGGRSLKSVLDKHGLVFEKFTKLHGSRYAVVRDYWAAVQHRIEIVDLEPLMPGLAALDAM